ncbi:Ubiquinone biosynthesis O-methyltransferase, mitochondrial [Paraburkholderia kirstenboschensis]|uniref:class I SAM-dependent methyltransferase n=1 Tax=Paraburkholderia kirstenboschensis TaxID=1245436 RepID=UPI000A959EA2|nr:class I SAM-dependent methyltransferase [Paraburkholderia kirstenboschensis]CAD6559874.1 Ubiquinone biosynthesis O-methyltransferase, mitochondrial [Paraburkholderia kirstenboschensis]
MTSTIPELGIFFPLPKEVGRYSVIVGYCLHFKPAARVLDVGCGTGILARWLSGAAISSYLGIDLSEAAIEKARQSNIQGAEFAVADGTAFKTSQLFDVIVFNEVLYYIRTPEDLCQPVRLRAGFELSPDGTHGHIPSCRGFVALRRERVVFEPD